jgi:desulfoferrodoxin (superoxide reductase-like protein)
MKRIKRSVLLFAIMLSVFAATDLLANQSSVEIIVPDTAVRGKEITIQIKVTHNGNSSFHHTEWAYVKVNGQEIARWVYPFESEVFTREVKYKVTGPVEIEAKANCNLHGSAGPKFTKIEVK